MIGFTGTLVTSSLNHAYYSAIADLHNLQFAVAHALGFSVATSRLQATDLNTETSTSNHNEVFLPFLVHSPWNVGTQLKTLLFICQSQSQSHIATDGQSVSQQVLVSRPDIFYCLTVTVLFLWGALSDERSGSSNVDCKGLHGSYAHGKRRVYTKLANF
jgi:hypothetical protein